MSGFGACELGVSTSDTSFRASCLSIIPVITIARRRRNLRSPVVANLQDMIETIAGLDSLSIKSLTLAALCRPLKPSKPRPSHQLLSCHLPF